MAGKYSRQSLKHLVSLSPISRTITRYLSSRTTHRHSHGGLTSRIHPQHSLAARSRSRSMHPHHENEAPSRLKAGSGMRQVTSGLCVGPSWRIRWHGEHRPNLMVSILKIRFNFSTFHGSRMQTWKQGPSTRPRPGPQTQPRPL